VNTILAIASLVLAPEEAVPAPQATEGASCQSYMRQTPGAPELVRAWLAHSRDDHVLVCMPEPRGASGSEAQYSGESTVSKEGGVCRYATHLLGRAGLGTMAHLQRYEATEAIAMAAVGEGGCPRPHDPAMPKRYTMTYDVTPAGFESLMAFWGAAAISSREFDRSLACCGAAGAASTAGGATANAVRLRLRAAIAGGRMQSAAVTRIVRMTAHALHRRYALFIEDPENRTGGRIYVVYVTRLLREPWHITGLSDAAP
jgi:hypothetical protein